MVQFRRRVRPLWSGVRQASHRLLSRKGKKPAVSRTNARTQAAGRAAGRAGRKVLTTYHQGVQRIQSIRVPTEMGIQRLRSIRIPKRKAKTAKRPLSSRGRSIRESTSNYQISMPESLGHMDFSDMLFSISEIANSDVPPGQTPTSRPVSRPARNSRLPSRHRDIRRVTVQYEVDEVGTLSQPEHLSERDQDEQWQDEDHDSAGDKAAGQTEGKGKQPRQEKEATDRDKNRDAREKPRPAPLSTSASSSQTSCSSSTSQLSTRRLRRRVSSSPSVASYETLTPTEIYSELLDVVQSALSHIRYAVCGPAALVAWGKEDTLEAVPKTAETAETTVRHVVASTSVSAASAASAASTASRVSPVASRFRPSTPASLGVASPTRPSISKSASPSASASASLSASLSAGSPAAASFAAASSIAGISPLPSFPQPSTSPTSPTSLTLPLPPSPSPSPPPPSPPPPAWQRCLSIACCRSAMDVIESWAACTGLHVYPGQPNVLGIPIARRHGRVRFYPLVIRWLDDDMFAQHRVVTLADTAVGPSVQVLSLSALTNLAAHDYAHSEAVAADPVLRHALSQDILWMLRRIATARSSYSLFGTMAGVSLGPGAGAGSASAVRTASPTFALASSSTASTTASPAGTPSATSPTSATSPRSVRTTTKTVLSSGTAASAKIIGKLTRQNAPAVLDPLFYEVFPVEYPEARHLFALAGLRLPTDTYNASDDVPVHAHNHSHSHGHSHSHSHSTNHSGHALADVPEGSSSRHNNTGNNSTLNLASPVWLTKPLPRIPSRRQRISEALQERLVEGRTMLTRQMSAGSWRARTFFEEAKKKRSVT